MSTVSSYNTVEERAKLRLNKSEHVEHVNQLCHFCVQHGRRRPLAFEKRDNANFNSEELGMSGEVANDLNSKSFSSNAKHGQINQTAVYTSLSRSSTLAESNVNLFFCHI